MEDRKLLERLEAKIDRLDSKLDTLDTRIDKIDVTLASQHGSLKEHMRRTSLLEAGVKDRDEALAADLKPIKAHVSLVSSIFIVFAAIGGIVAAIASTISVLEFLGK